MESNHFLTLAQEATGQEVSEGAAGMGCLCASCAALEGRGTGCWAGITWRLFHHMSGDQDGSLGPPDGLGFLIAWWSQGLDTVCGAQCSGQDKLRGLSLPTLEITRPQMSSLGYSSHKFTRFTGRQHRPPTQPLLEGGSV